MLRHCPPKPNQPEAICRDRKASLVTSASVAVTPGLDFDKSRGNQTLRLSYARSTPDIEEGLRRLEAYMREAGHIS